MRYRSIFVLFVLSLASCAELSTLTQTTTPPAPLTEGEVIRGLKAALEKGITEASKQASQTNGYYGNSLIKIPFPPDAEKVETRLRQMGLGGEVDTFITSLNRAAEQASKEAVDVFVGAIRQMTIEDAWGILRGEQDAATLYLKRTTTPELERRFQPIVSNALNTVNATKYYGDLVNTYNKIPLVTRVDPDLEGYATQKAIDGLFVLVAQEEAKIREDPVARTSDILKRVFGYEGS